MSARIVQEVTAEAVAVLKGEQETQRLPSGKPRFITLRIHVLRSLLQPITGTCSLSLAIRQGTYWIGDQLPNFGRKAQNAYIYLFRYCTLNFYLIKSQVKRHDETRFQTHTSPFCHSKSPPPLFYHGKTLYWQMKESFLVGIHQAKPRICGVTHIF